MDQIYLSNIDGLYVLILSVILGIEVIKNVPALLHTPLMSGANAISGIILIGGIIQMLTIDYQNIVGMILAVIAVILGSINISGGYFVTHRMLAMFNTK